MGAEDAARCDGFFDRLEQLSRAEWIEIGRRVVARRAGDEGVSVEAAASALDATITARQLAVTAWLVNDAVQTVASVTSRGRGCRAWGTSRS